MEIRWNETSDKRALGKAILHAVSHLVQMMTSRITPQQLLSMPRTRVTRFKL
jgi:hypothetical protein